MMTPGVPKKEPYPRNCPQCTKEFLFDPMFARDALCDDCRVAIELPTGARNRYHDRSVAVKNSREALDGFQRDAFFSLVGEIRDSTEVAVVLDEYRHDNVISIDVRRIGDALRDGIAVQLPYEKMMIWLEGLRAAAILFSMPGSD